MTASPTRRDGALGAPAHLRVYHFGPDAAFEGYLLTAIERAQSRDDAELLDALFVRRDPSSGALHVVDLAAGVADGTFAALLDFRLEPRRRRAITERTLAEHPGGVPRPLIEAVAATLEAGAAIFAVLERGVATAIGDAVARCGGRPIADEQVDARALAEAGPQLRAAIGSPEA